MTKTAPAAEAARKARKRPFLPPQFVQAMLAGHSALGLAFAALIYVVCLTGTLAVFIHEFHRWEQPDAPMVTAPISAEALTEATWQGHGQARIDRAAEDMFISAPNAFYPRLSVSYRSSATKNEGEWVADQDGNLKTRVIAPFTDFLGELHMNLHLPRTWGLFIVGLTGVTLLSSLISGLLSHPRLFKDAFALRWGGSKRLQEADLHNRLGVWGFPFHLVVSLTGALLGLSTLIVGVLALAAYDGDSEKAFAAILGPRATASENYAPLPDINPMIAAVRQQKPSAEFVGAQFQRIGTQGQMVHLSMRVPGHLALFNQYYFNPAGKLIGDGGLEEGGVGQQILGVLQPLHFGWFGGIGVKILYAILGLALTIVTQSGVVIWLARKRDRGYPAVRWERVWTALVWSQPLALAVPALVALRTGGEEWLVALYYLLVAGCIAAALAMRDAATVRAVLQSTSAAALLLLAVAHFMKWRVLGIDPVSHWVDAVILAIGIVIGVLATKALFAARQAAVLAAR